MFTKQSVMDGFIAAAIALYVIWILEISTFSLEWWVVDILVISLVNLLIYLCRNYEDMKEDNEIDPNL